MRTPIDRELLRRLLARHRRVIAASLAGLAALLALSVIRAPQEPAPATDLPAIGSGPTLGEVAVPVILKDPAVASITEPGDLVDVIAVPEAVPGSGEAAQPARIVARRARVIEAADPGSGLMPMTTPVLVVAVDEATALALAEAGKNLSIAVHPTA